MSDLRWSYDTRTDELDVWDSENNRIQHFDRCGFEGYEYCFQGRIYADEVWIYRDRPIRDELNIDDNREKAKAAVEQYIEDNDLGELEWHEIN